MEIQAPTPSSAAWPSAPAGRDKRRTLIVAVVAITIMVAVVGALGLAVSRYFVVPNERPELVGAVQSSVQQAGDGGIVDFRTVTTFDWDRMYEFGAYTGDSQVSRVLGFPWGTDDDLRLPNDGFVLLIFAKDREVTGWVVLNDYQSTGPLVRFDDALDGVPVLRDAAVFRADLEGERTSGGWAMYRLMLTK